MCQVTTAASGVAIAVAASKAVLPSLQTQASILLLLLLPPYLPSSVGT
jgi:hypothetical protein